MNARISGFGVELPREDIEARRKDLFVLPQSLGLDLERLDLGRFFARDTGTEPSSTSAGTSRERSSTVARRACRTQTAAASHPGEGRHQESPATTPAATTPNTRHGARAPVPP